MTIRKGRSLLWLALLALLVPGMILLFTGLSQRTAPVAAPVPRHPFVLPPQQHKAGSPPVSLPISAVQTVLQPWTALGPTQVSVPSLSIRAPLVPESLEDGTSTLTIPSDVHHVGVWSGGGAITGVTGTVLLAGHVNWYNQGNGALYNLATIKPGAIINVTGSSGKVTAWTAVSLQMVSNAQLPQTVFAGPKGPRELVLVTCGGPFTTSSHLYLDNVVVRAVPLL